VPSDQAELRIRQAMSLQLSGNDAGAATIRDYLVILLAKVWQEADGFSGKRPFGSSDWQTELAHDLITAGLVRGEIDEEEGYVVTVDRDEVDELMLACISSLGYVAQVDRS
jgi:hypothetical protein